MAYQVDSLKSQLEAFERAKQQDIRTLQHELNEAHHRASSVNNIAGVK